LNWTIRSGLTRVATIKVVEELSMGSQVEPLRSFGGEGVVALQQHGVPHIVIVENSALIRGSLARALIGSLHCGVSEYPTANDFLKEKEPSKDTVVILSFASRVWYSIHMDIALITGARPATRTIVFAHEEGPKAALFAISHGAKGYVPITIGWTGAVEAIRIVVAGGIYMPPECVIAPQSSPPIAPNPPPSNGITVREMAVLRAIQQGKPNKIIAHELSLRESTVKAHIRNIMFKLRRKNRTELAVMSRDILTAE
jgi:DNA-binding NarL/FixJ family response regulator